MTAAAPTERASTPVSHRAFPCLDGVRALAVTMVFVFHASAFLPVWVQRHFARYWIHLDLGVTIFFVLSGSLIYRPFVVEHAQRQVSSVRRYAIRRFARIFPAYWLALIGMAIWGGTNLHGAGDVIQNATLTFTYFKDPGIAIPQAWSLVVEISFYAFVPLWALAVRRLARRDDWFRAELVGVVGVIAIGYVAAAFNSYDDLPRVLTVLPPALGALGLGMLLAILHTRARTAPGLHARLERVFRWGGAWWIAAIGAFVLISLRHYGFRPTPGSTTADERLWTAMIAPMFAVLVVAPTALGNQRRGRLRAVLASRPIAFVGIVSYGIYLWHFRVIVELGSDIANGIASWPPAGWRAGIPTPLILFVFTLMIAATSWYAFERPLLAFAHRSRRRPPSPADDARPVTAGTTSVANAPTLSVEG